MPSRTEAAVTRRRPRNDIRLHILTNMAYPEQQVPLFFCICKDIFIYLLDRISTSDASLANGNRLISPRDASLTNGKHVFQVNSSVVKCVKAFHRQTPVYIIDSVDAANEIINLKLRRAKILGLDCEWVNGKEGWPVALLQLATPNECLLIRLSSMCAVIPDPSMMCAVVPDALKELLEDRRVLKFGVAILEDAKRLSKMGIILRGVVDLQNVVHRCQKPNDVLQNKQRLSLFALASSILGIKLDKTLTTRCSNWEADQLTKNQIAYASHDAIVSLQIFLVLVTGKIVNKNDKYSRREFNNVDDLFVYQASDSCSTDGSDSCSIDATRDVTRYLFNQETGKISAFNNKQNIIVDFSDEFLKQAMSLCQGLVDLNKDKQRHQNKHKDEKLIAAFSQRNTACEGKPIKIEKDGMTPAVRSQPFYQNCYIIAPDGTILCTCDKKKAEWYVNRQLGVVDKEEPYTVRLSFAPNIPTMFERDYYVTEKENRCVVCGRDDQYMRKMIIPRDYRRHFPDELKNHISHDILLLCPPCHRLSSLHDEQLRHNIAQQYNIPVSQAAADQVTSLKVKSAAKALLNSKDKLPPERKRALEKLLETHEKVNRDELDDGRLKQIINGTVRHHCHSESNAAKVIEKVLDGGQLRDFVKRWREHFLETMKPRFLPPLWSAEHNLMVEKINKCKLRQKADVASDI